MVANNQVAWSLQPSMPHSWSEEVCPPLIPRYISVPNSSINIGRVQQRTDSEIDEVSERWTGVRGSSFHTGLPHARIAAFQSSLLVVSMPWAIHWDQKPLALMKATSLVVHSLFVAFVPSGQKVIQNT